IGKAVADAGHVGVFGVHVQSPDTRVEKSHNLIVAKALSEQYHLIGHSSSSLRSQRFVCPRPWHLRCAHAALFQSMMVAIQSDAQTSPDTSMTVTASRLRVSSGRTIAASLPFRRSYSGVASAMGRYPNDPRTQRPGLPVFKFAG